MASRKRRGLAPRLRAAKTKPTPKQPPGNMTRYTANRLLSARAQRELAGDTRGAAERALDLIRGSRRDEHDALEKMLREAGAVDLGGKR